MQDLQSATWRPRRFNRINYNLSLSLKVGEVNCPSLKTVKLGKIISSYLAFYFSYRLQRFG